MSVDSHSVPRVQPTHHGELDRGLGLCLSGGGYRAMLFHVGSLIRLNELGLLRHVHRISSVSGGSITAAQLALAWPKLWPNLPFEDRPIVNGAMSPPATVQPSPSVANLGDLLTYFVIPLMQLGQRTTLAPSSLVSIAVDKLKGLVPKSGFEHGAAHVLSEELDKQFSSASLKNLPIPLRSVHNHVSLTPEFYFNACNLSTGNLFLFNRRYLGEDQVGYLHYPVDLKLSKVVAASSAFPPLISPAVLQLAGENWVKRRPDLQVDWEMDSHPTNEEAAANGENNYALKIAERRMREAARAVGAPPIINPTPSTDNHSTLKVVCPDLKDRVRMTDAQLLTARKAPALYLGDGGIYDNLGLDVVIRKFKTVLVSDAGQSIEFNAAPATDYFEHGIDTALLLDQQVRVLRKAGLTKMYQTNDPSPDSRDGAYWSIRGDPSEEWVDALKESVLTPEQRNEQSMLDLRKLCQTWNLQKTEPLAKIRTGLSALSNDQVRDLIDWGYIRTASSMANFYVHPNELTPAIQYHQFAPIRVPSKLMSRL